MKALISAALDRSSATLLFLLFLLIGGIAAYVAIPKESDPDVSIPYIYVAMQLEGISPEDAERLLVRPMEQELRSLAGVKEMTSTASEGRATVTLEFDAGFNARQALADVREKVDNARSKLPEEAEEPEVQEINISLFPVLAIGLSGPVSEPELVYAARRLKDSIEGIGDVLEVDIGGDREDLLEILVDPQVLDSYGIDYAELFSLVSSNNRLVAAGSLDTGAGRMSIKVPGVIENLEDVMSLPIKVRGNSVVTFADVATIRRTFKDPVGFARLNGQPAVVLEVSKRSGANIIQTIEQVKALMEQAKPLLPKGVVVSYVMDDSIEIREMLADLMNNVLTAIVLVLILIIATMGVRPALLVGLSIPGSFFTGILLIWMLGYTMNMVVLFSLILVSGMLVDGAIVVSELADRYLSQGQPPRKAWANAATRMAWPVFSSTATTLMVFLPLLFWPGVVGEFMFYIPVTVVLCLLASLAMALVFMPVLGAVTGGKVQPPSSQASAGGLAYRRLLQKLVARPGLTLAGMLGVIALIYLAYGRFNHGVEFFPEVEPDSAQVLVHARGDLSIHEKDALVQKVEARLLGMPELEGIYARSMAFPEGGRLGEDVIGVLQFNFIDWQERRRWSLIQADMLQRTENLPGVRLEFRKETSGPGEGKPFNLKVSSHDPAQAAQWVESLRGIMDGLGGFKDIEDDRALPGVEWRMKVDRESAARFGADVLSVGNAVQMVTNGLKLSTYRPEDATDEVDIRVRLPDNWRSLDQFGRLTLRSAQGQVPLSNFVSLEPAPKVGTLRRVDGQRTITVQADIAEDHRLDERLQALMEAIGQPPEGIMLRVGGEEEDQQEAADFLMLAFAVAVFGMAMILVLQFNSIYQALLVLSAIVLSTAGVLLGLLVNSQAFGIVMVGMGVIALAGIVVNNNIILIDTYNHLRQQGLDSPRAALEAGCLRLRPVLLTAVTTVLGLLPMVLGVNVDLVNASLGIGAPSTQWWTQMSSAIAGGLSFATVLTLLVTPCMLVLGARFEPAFKPLDVADAELLDIPDEFNAALRQKQAISTVQER
ncbi:efflux RND transporter permease subunit [Pseudomonas sp. N040]|uniref:efflux RND transporter permease subunit n=1 Tax=Pseudomonas sp. N040 TaxID=2785325 RepID=UPI0018A335B8|nr:efflux RND transporter permease subunit [Pseudomonas sp. N040]MBF7730451.1 efflux RND transporter permease subunit [Pseudomonas sp. N040]MBW7014094.1 efflux RND transporter permease subunit [Pseudomonas sp. N040]